MVDVNGLLDYVSGDLLSSRLDVAALGLIPLRLEPQWDWDPEEEYWGEEGEPIDEWARPIIARGPRPAFSYGCRRRISALVIVSHAAGEPSARIYR